MAKSAIEWTEETWNPIVGCSLKSPGCVHCYAMSMAARIEAINAAMVAVGKPPQSPQYDGTTQIVNGHAVWTGKLALSEKTLLKPLKRKKPTTYFVNSMGDLFHEDCQDEWIDRVFAVMALCPQHTFQVLTKRAARMRDYLQEGRQNVVAWEPVAEIMKAWCPDWASEGINGPHRRLAIAAGTTWPLPNVWLGVSTERQQEADERIPLLLRTPAAIRFVSAEPLLGPIALDNIVTKGDGFEDHRSALECDVAIEDDEEFAGATLDWVICGGESGPDARPMHPDWARSLRDQCAAASVPFFFKQWGSWYPMIDLDKDDPDWQRDYMITKSDPHKYRILNLAGGGGFHGARVHLMQRYSKKATGKLLDGVKHQAMPELRGEHRARSALEVSRG